MRYQISSCAIAAVLALQLGSAAAQPVTATEAAHAAEEQPPAADAGAVPAVVVEPAVGAPVLDAPLPAVVELPAQDDAGGWIGHLTRSALAGKWLAAVGAVIMLLVAGLLRFTPVGWPASKVGKMALAMGVAAALVLGPALAAEQLSWGLVPLILTAAMAAAGANAWANMIRDWRARKIE